MAKSKRLMATALTVVMVAALPLAATATEDRAVDRGIDVVERDRAQRDSVTDRPVTDRRVTDRPVTDRPVTDRPITDRPVTDRRPDVTDVRGDVTDLRRCVHLVDQPRRCVDGMDDIQNVRHLIWRLINAHEWKKLVRLLHALGWL